jgi:hypothetical protein
VIVATRPHRLGLARHRCSPANESHTPSGMPCQNRGAHQGQGRIVPSRCNPAPAGDVAAGVGGGETGDTDGGESLTWNWLRKAAQDGGIVRETGRSVVRNLTVTKGRPRNRLSCLTTAGHHR